MIHSTRKDDHVYHAIKQYHDHSHDDFLLTTFVHQALPQVNLSDVSLQTNIGNMTLDYPFFINAMTGGSLQTATINEQLAIVARETQLAMATGSVSVALNHPQTANSFQIIRTVNPDGLVFANLGAHHSLENAKRAIDLLQANALQIHLNAAQELVMPEGDRQFSSWLKNIENIVSHSHVPIIVKEVGFGLSRESVQQLQQVGVSIVDVSGKGGTNFVTIEQARHTDNSSHFLDNWGQSTLTSLIDVLSLPSSNRPEVIASGGIKTIADTAKCLAVGAKAVGLSAKLLHTLQSSGIEATILLVNQWKDDLKQLMTLLGAKSIADLQHTQLILSPAIQNWANARDIDWKYYANRT